MKKLILTSLCIICINLANAQFGCSCLPEGITFNTQQEIDDFQANHPNCTEIEGDVHIGDWDGSDITNLNGLSVLTSIQESLHIAHNGSLSNLTGLDNLNSIGGSLVIGDNPFLSSLAGLEGLTSIGEDLCLSVTGENAIHIGNPLLTSLDALGNLAYLGGTLEIENTSLNNLTGLEGLTSIEGSLWISQNDSLSSLTGLENVNSIGGHLYISENYSLSSLTGLYNLTSIGGELIIFLNSTLTNLTGLDNIAPGSISRLRIFFNFALSTCDLQSICDYLEAPGSIVSIVGNAPGCNSPQEVEEACIQTSIEDQSHTFEISLAPNPVISYAVISVDLRTNSSMQISIFNTTGNCLKSWQYSNPQTTRKEYQLDFTDIPSGIYFCRIQAGNEVGTKKIIKL